MASMIQGAGTFVCGAGAGLVFALIGQGGSAPGLGLLLVTAGVLLAPAAWHAQRDESADVQPQAAK